MNNELNTMWGTEEDMEMFAIINENHLKAKRESVKRSKKAKREAFMVKAIMFLIGVGMTIGTLLVIYLVAWIESLTF